MKRWLPTVAPEVDRPRRRCNNGTQAVVLKDEIWEGVGSNCLVAVLA